MFLAVYEDLEVFKGLNGFLKGLAVSIAAIAIVFIILLLIIFTVKIMQSIIDKVNGQAKETTKEEVAEAPTQAPVVAKQSVSVEEMDDDMMVAALIATIDFKNETDQDAKLVSIKRIG